MLYDGGQDEKITKENLRDFNMNVRWQGHVNTLPADHIGGWWWMF